MTDYLTRLVERAQGEAAALQPRIPSRYDPGPGRLPDADPSVTIGEDQPIVGFSDDIPDGEPVRCRAPVGLRAASPTSNADVGPDRIAEMVHPSAPRPAPRPIPPLELAVRPAVPPRAILETASDQNTGAVPESASAGDHVQPESASAAPVTARNSEQSAPATKGRAVPEVAESRVSQPEALLLPALVDVPPLAPPEAETRVIRVTIGRIDVRAVSPPAAVPKRSRPPAPRVSLEDYLRSRSRGERQ